MRPFCSARLAAGGCSGGGLTCRLQLLDVTEAVMANELELFHWWFHDDITGQRLRTLCAMDRATATALFGNVQPDEPTRVVRTVHQLGESVADAERPSNLHAVALRNVEDSTVRR